MNFEGFLNNLKQEEINFYDKLVRQYHELDSKREEYRPKDDSEEARKIWFDFVERRDKICSDYDVHDYSETITKYGEEKYKTRLNNHISEHIEKLSKSIQKEIGKVVSIESTDDNKYHLEGNNGACNIVVSPIKIGPSGSVVKTRIKVLDTVKRDKPLDYVPEKEDNEYIKEWKANELKEYIRINDEFWTKYDDLKKGYNEARDLLNKAITEYRRENGTSPEIKDRFRGRVTYVDEDIEKLNSRYNEVNNKILELIQYNRFFYENGHKSDYEEIFKKAINDHFKKLQAKVEGKIGEIVKIYPLNNSGADYRFEGTKGDCNVEVILAGGYNIQRLHTRWIITNVKLKNEAQN